MSLYIAPAHLDFDHQPLVLLLLDRLQAPKMSFLVYMYVHTSGNASVRLVIYGLAKKLKNNEHSLFEAEE